MGGAASARLPTKASAPGSWAAGVRGTFATFTSHEKINPHVLEGTRPGRPQEGSEPRA